MDKGNLNTTYSDLRYMIMSVFDVMTGETESMLCRNAPRDCEVARETRLEFVPAKNPIEQFEIF